MTEARVGGAGGQLGGRLGVGEVLGFGRLRWGLLPGEWLPACDKREAHVPGRDGSWSGWVSVPFRREVLARDS